MVLGLALHGALVQKQKIKKIRDNGSWQDEIMVSLVMV